MTLDSNPGMFRYTQVLTNQEARNQAEVGRTFYIAGMELEGCVIQQFPGTEMMVADPQSGYFGPESSAPERYRGGYEEHVFGVVEK